MAKHILEVKNLSKEFYIKSKNKKDKKDITVKAVSDVSFCVEQGETFGLVGESGCGKTTLGRCIVRGVDATCGEVIYKTKDGEDLEFLSANKEQYKKVRKDIQMIFQDPYSSLDPRMTVFDIISEPLRANFKLTRTELEDKVRVIAEKTGLNVSYLKRYPHAFSGGQRQRIGIARALITQPDLIVCDEAVSALDVSIQAQVINLLEDLQKELKLTYIFISHDLSVVKHISDRVAVMYLGEIVELAKTEELFSNPKHPYTAALLSAIPEANPNDIKKRIMLKGEIPDPSNLPTGCHFNPRCQYRDEKCSCEAPKLYEISKDHYVSCHYADKLNVTEK